jgi:uncharacterized cupin superfamily protein
MPTTTPPKDYYLPAEKLIRGNPKQTVWSHYTDPSGQFSVGVWRSEPGAWRVSYTEEEYCRMLEGNSILTSEAGLCWRWLWGMSLWCSAGCTKPVRMELLCV